jgi:glycosyltransferase involved in cell wall biosynthesis
MMPHWGWTALAGFALLSSAIPLLVTMGNLRLYRGTHAGRRARPHGVPAQEPGADRASAESHGEGAVAVTVCIPARNEAANIEACVRSALACDGVEVEVCVYDDHSTDGTGDIVRRIAAEDPRVRIVPTVPLPDGWNGKMWGCDRMGRAARGEWVLFTDADVRLAPECLSATVAAAESLRCDLLSTVPRQLTGSWAEDAIVPLIHYVLLGYLPMGRMRATLDPAASAGCGQFMFARRDAWLAIDGYSRFCGTMHDGIRMPREFRRAGLRTDLFDGTSLAQVRMYRGFAQTWRGFAKNAYEGLGSPVLLLLVTALHVFGQVAAWAILVGSAVAAAAGLSVSPLPAWIAAAAIAVQLAHRIILRKAFGHSWRAVLLHPIGLAMLTAIQWHSLWLSVRGRREWRGRVAGLPAQGSSAG